jgi:hypothetical protein
MRSSCISRSFFLLSALALCVPAAGLAEGPPTGEDTGITLTLSAVEQFRADIGDSRLDVSRYRMKADVDLLKSRKLVLGAGTSYGISEYNFTGQPADPWSDPWQKVNTADLGLNSIWPGSGKWSYFLAGRLDWSWEEGGDASDSLRYGIIGSAAYSKRHDKRIGFGAGVFEGLEETKFFPYVVVSWRLNEKLTLRNPLQAGPVGPAGIELVYDVTENWNLGSGAAYRSFRFRLDEEGIAPGGIGETKSVPVWARATRQRHSGYRLDLYMGIIFAGQAVIEDNDGRRLESQDFDPAPLAAAMLEWEL